MAIVNYRQQQDEEIKVKAKCGQPGCIYDARVRMWKKTGGYMDVCKPCYDRLFQTYAHTWCIKRGLDTKEKQIAFCKRIGRSMGVEVPA